MSKNFKTENLQKYVYCYECCRLTKGELRSIIIDTQRNHFYFIPNDLYFILIENQGEKIETLLKKQGKINEKIVIEYIKFLVDKELLYLSDNKISLSSLNLEYSYPFPIQNVLIDFKSILKIDLKKVLADLESLFAACIQFRIYDNTEYFFNKIINQLGEYTFENIEIVINYSDKISLDNILSEVQKNPYITHLKVYNYPIKKQNKIKPKLLLYNHSFSSHIDCGVIGPDYFTTNLYHIIEGKEHNNCLYKKISIDENGFLKHCPSMDLNFGKYSKENLLNAINDDRYISYGKITKKNITTCGICEFRDICTDCRAHLSNPNDILSKPLKCKYNPSTGLWS